MAGSKTQRSCCMYNHICLFIHIMQRKALGVFTNTLALEGAPILFLYRTAMRYLAIPNERTQPCRCPIEYRYSIQRVI